MKKHSTVSVGFMIAIVSIAAGVVFVPILSKSPSKELNLNRFDFEQLALRASQGESDAAVRISDYYLVFKQDIEKSAEWRTVAAKLGDLKSKDWIESNWKQNEKYGKKRPQP